MSLFSSQSGRHLLDGTARAFLAGLLLPLTGIVTAAFLTRRLGVDGYGLLVLATTLFGWIEFTINSFFSRATIRFIGEAPDWRPVGMTVIRMHALAGVGGGLLLGLLSFPLAWLFDEPLLAPYLALYALHVPISSLSQGHQNILIGMGSFRKKAMSNAGRWLARLFLILLLVEMGLSVPGAILGSLGAATVELAITRRYIKPPLLGHIAVPTRPFFDLGIVLALSSLGLQMFSSLGLVMLKTLGGTIEEVGIYGAAQNLAILPALFGTSFSPLLLSTVSRLLAEGKTGQARGIGQGALRITVGLFPFGALVAGAAPEIVTLVFGQSFELAAPILAILIVGAIAFVMVSVAAVVATVSGVPRFALYLSLPLVLLAAIGNYLLIPPFGASGAAAATVLCQAVGAVAAIGVVHRLWSIVPPIGTLWRSAVISALAYTLAMMWPTTGIMLLVKLASIAVGIVVAYLALREFTVDEITQTRSFLPWNVLPTAQQQKT
ncbi:MAG: oligosaccharide flippase family protein [Nitrospira sp. CR1.3]|nr:oligosaccharide flippase family protein [Nitrospira sp. CR1.3]